jgi:hypothetical protein
MPEVWLIVAETCEPYDVAAWRVPAIAIDGGLETAVRIATEYRACERAGVFPGVQSDDVELPLPPWYVGPQNGDLDSIMPMDANDL